MRHQLLSWFRRWTRSQRLHQAAEFWGQHHQADCQDHAFWLADERIMHWVNRKISGQPQIWPLSWFLLSLEEHLVPVPHALSIGCGPGNLEREVMRHQSAQRITGIDVSRSSLDLAERCAREAGYSQEITYVLSDAESWLRTRIQERSLDLVFFHASLHHIESLESVLELCAQKLCHGTPGLLYLDEYIGPSRDEWTPGHLGYSTALFERVPVEFRQSSTLVPPVAFEDPTEMIRSSEIISVLKSYFQVVEYKPYFGNVVMPLVSGIRPSGLDDPRVEAIVTEAMELEDFLISQQMIDPMYAVIIGRPN